MSEWFCWFLLWGMGMRRLLMVFVSLASLLWASGASAAENTVFFEGWETLALGYPRCESREGSANCGFTADSGQWSVGEYTDVIPVGNRLTSVQVISGKRIKLGKANGLGGDLYSPSTRYHPLVPGMTLSFTDHTADLGASNTTSYVMARAYIEAPGFVPCPGTGYRVGDTYIEYILEKEAGATLPDTLPCTARINVGKVNSLSRDLYKDFKDYLPFDPTGWAFFRVKFTVEPGGGGADPSLSATFDNIKVTVPEEEGPVTPPQTSFWSEIRSDLSALPIRSIPSTSGNTPIKQLPNGWAIEVTSVYDSNGNIVTGNGYRWYQVKDGTDGTTGWMPAGRWQNGAFVGAPFLPDDLPNQASLELDATGTYDSRKERANAISVLFENYYNEDNSDSTLWGGIANAYLKKNAFPVQVIAAMTLRESGGIDFDNDWVTWDYGHGIKQVTSRNYIGGASKVSIPQCEGSDNKRKACYTPINPANERSPKRYTITERYYTNTALGMAANVKDGFNVLVEKHQGSIEAIRPNGRTWKAPTDQYITENPSYIDSQYVVSETEMRVLRTTRAYNGLGPDCLRFNVADKHEYLRPVADLMAKVHENFPTLPKDGESPPFTDLAEKMRKVELDKENISLCSPGVLRIIDEEGRVTGFVGADLIDEIPTVVYDTEAGKAAVVHLIDQRFRYQVVGTEEGVYTLYIDKTTQDDVVTVQLKNVPLLLGEVYTYSIDWQAVRRGEKGVQVEIDREGDGTPEEVFTVGASVDDTVPPTTTHKRYGGTIYLNADDGEGVGVSAVAVSLNGDSWKKVSGVRAQVTLGVGENHLRFYATDHLGNTEAVQSLTVYVQGSDPTPIPAITPWGFVILFLTETLINSNLKDCM